MAWDDANSFMDGADHYDTAHLAAKWSSVGNLVSVSSSVFRNSGKSILFGSGTGSRLTRYTGQNRNFCIGFGLRMDTANGSSSVNANGNLLFSANNSINGGANAQLGLQIQNDGLIRAVRGDLGSLNGFSSGGVVLGTATTQINTATWYYVEFKGFIDNSGSCELKINGVTQFTLTGIDTQHLAVDYFTYLTLHAASSNMYYDDIYFRVSSQTSAETGGYFGDVKIKPFYPNGDGTYSEMAPSTGSTHYTLVDEASPSTSDYVSSATAGHRDSYQFENSSETGTIKAVQHSVYAAKDDGGYRSIDMLVISGATESYSAEKPLTVTEGYRSNFTTKNPNTSNDWSQSEFNAAQFGQRITSSV